MIDIIESRYITSAVNKNSYPDLLFPEFAFVGKSNVGKSSMINTLTNRKLLAKIANKPGKTRMINFFAIKYRLPHLSASCVLPEVGNTFNFFTLVDLPGYGFAKVSISERASWQKMINDFFLFRKQLRGVILLVDIRHDADMKDLVMIRLLQELQINFMIIATKSDKVPSTKIKSFLNNLERGFGLNMKSKENDTLIHSTSNKFVSFEKKVILSAFSSLKKTGQKEILEWIEMRLREERDYLQSQ